MFRNCDGKHQRLSFWFAKLAQTIVTYTLICFIGESLQDKVSLWLWIAARWRPVLLIVWLPEFNLRVRVCIVIAANQSCAALPPYGAGSRCKMPMGLLKGMRLE